MKLKRGFTVILAVLFVAALMLSLTFIAENFHHDCTGHDCVICQMLETAETIFDSKTEDSNTASTTLNHFFTENQPVIDNNDGAVVITPVLLHDLLTI